MATSRRFDVLFVGTLPPYPGGSALSNGSLIAGFAAGGHTVRAVAPLALADAAPPDAFAAAHPRLAIERIAVSRYDFDHTRPLSEDHRQHERAALRARVRALIDAARPDVMMSGRESFAIHACDLAAGAGIPFLLRAAGGMTGELLNSTLAAPLADGLRDAYKRADVIVSPSEHMAHRLRTELGLPHVRAIRNGVDLQVFAPRPKPSALRRRLGIEDSAVVVLHASNLVASKRSLEIVASATAVLRTDPHVVYVVAGDGPLRSAMEAACRQHGLSERFRFVGWVDHAQMPAYMNLADILVHPAQTEAQERVYLEAQASACVVLASDIAAAREVIRDGESGLLHRFGDTRDLAERTLLAANDRELRVAIGRRARARVQVHDVRDTVRAYVATLAELVDREAPSIG